MIQLFKMMKYELNWKNGQRGNLVMKKLYRITLHMKNIFQYYCYGSFNIYQGQTEANHTKPGLTFQL
jgi:hypothetical protein